MIFISECAVIFSYVNDSHRQASGFENESHLKMAVARLVPIKTKGAGSLSSQEQAGRGSGTPGIERDLICCRVAELKIGAGFAVFLEKRVCHRS